MSGAASNKEVAALILDFVKTSVKQKTISEEYFESIDFVTSCISDSFGISEEEAEELVKTKFQNKSLNQLVGGSVDASSTASQEIPVNIDADEEEASKKAEEFKAAGNKLMVAKDYEGAIAEYTKAIEASPKTAVYYSNRAAAYSSSSKHNLAIKDAKKAIELDPKYSRAYSRLGLASYALGDLQASLDAYEKGLELEGDNAAMKRGYETVKKKMTEEKSSSSVETTASSNEDSSRSAPGANGMPDLGNLASMLGGGAGGMPDLGSLLNNPSLMSAAQEMMQNPDAMRNLMNNPMLQQMAQNFGMGGGSPSGGEAPSSSSGEQPNMQDLLNNPMLQNMARNFMNGGNNSGN